MYRRFGKWLVVVSLILTVGGHWAFLQTVAWVGMAVDYSSTDGISKGLVKTFDGKHPCKLCKFVRESKKAEKKSEAKVELKKLDCFGIAASSGFYFPRLKQISYSSVVSFLSRGKAPPTPPPLVG